MIQNGDTVEWNGAIPDNLLTNYENIAALSPMRVYTVREHWNSSDWCTLEEIPNFGYPRSIFQLVICQFEDVLNNVV